MQRSTTIRRLVGEDQAASCYFRTGVPDGHRKALVQLIEQCNLTCAHCFVSATKHGEIMPTDQVIELVIPRLAACRVTRVTLTGGEPFVHPGEILAEDLDDIGVSQAELARALGVPRSRISAIVRAERPITADTALRLSRYFGTSEGYWINMQARYDIERAKYEHADDLARVEPRRAS